MRLLALFAMLVFLLAPEAMAADMEKKDPAQEIVYRTNLGRANDVKLLIKKGVSPNQTDEKGTPLVALAATRKDNEGPNVLKALLDAGADIDAKDAEGQTALFYAVRQGNKSIIQFLLDRGISYYSPDNSGVIARTLAFQQGKQDIVELMDKFVTAQTDKVNKQYEEYNRQVEERNKKIEEQNKAAIEEVQRAAKEQTEKVTKQYEDYNQQIEEQNKAAMEEVERAAKKQAEDAAKPKVEDAPKPEAIEPKQSDSDEYLETLAPKETAPPVDKRGSTQFEMDMRNFAFQNCAFQYWSFCRKIKQRSDLSIEEMRVAIDTHREQVMALFKSIMIDYKLEKDMLDTISKNAMQRVNDDLENTSSSTYRLEHGVCLMPDLQTRCDEIADTWSQQLPTNKAASSSKGGASSTNSMKHPGIGSVGTKKK
jgi:hypothetical protein